MKILTVRSNKKEIENLFLKSIKEKINNYKDFISFINNLNFDIKANIPLCFDNTCRYCKQEILNEPVITKGYTYSIWFISHKECKSEGEKEEAYQVQKIDADCNDCKYFNRLQGNQGTCRKFNKEVTANPNFSSGHDCFIHRKD